MTEQFIPGLDTTARDLEGDSPPNAAQTTEVGVDTISLRASLRF